MNWLTFPDVGEPVQASTGLSGANTKKPARAGLFAYRTVEIVQLDALRLMRLRDATDKWIKPQITGNGLLHSGLALYRHACMELLAVTAIRFLAIVMTGLALIAPGAHVFELLRKMALLEPQYHIVQDIYRGWWIVGLLLPAALIANAALAIAVRDDGSARGLAIGAAALLLINLIVFAVWTLPVNRVTSDWTVHLPDWEALRRQWEYSHAVNAVITLAAFCASTLAALHRPSWP